MDAVVEKQKQKKKKEVTEKRTGPPYSCLAISRTSDSLGDDQWILSRATVHKNASRISSWKFHESHRGKRARFLDDRLAKVCHRMELIALSERLREGGHRWFSSTREDLSWYQYYAWFTAPRLSPCRDRNYLRFLMMVIRLTPCYSVIFVAKIV